MRLKDKVIVVTGGSRGIGRAISMICAQEGANVVVNYVSHEESALEVVKEIENIGGQAIPIKADVSNRAEVKQMVQTTIHKWGKIDGLINNAGVAPFVDFFDITDDLWDWVQSINVKGIFIASQEVAAEMVKTGGGKICNVTSISGEKATSNLQVPYCTSKAAANMLTKVMSVALAPHNIVVNAILPGTILTDINRDILADDAVRDGIIERTPLKCLGLPENIAHAAVYFVSDECAWTTGSLLVIDGGFIA